MITQFKILLFLLVLNLVSGYLVTAEVNGQYIVPGAGKSHGLNATGDVQYENEYNVTEKMNSWSATSYGFPVIGDIFSGASMLVGAIRNVVDGFPKMLDWCASFIPASGGDVAFAIIANILRGVFAFCALTLFIEFISGRSLLP